MRFLPVLFFLVAFVAASFSAQGTTYYVSTTGNDALSGTSIANAWASIGKVNNTRFFPGDTILFEGGMIFPGSLYFGPEVKGTASKPIVLGSYGVDRAVISSGGSRGMMAYNTAGFKLKDLVFQGAGRTSNTTNGVEFYTDLLNSRLDFVAMENVEVYGYYDAGISIGSWNGASGFDNVSITRSAVHDNGDAGIESYAEARLGHRNVYIGYTKVYNNAGIPTKTNLHSGNGIVLGGVDGGIIEYCEAYNNGWLNAWKDGGPVGIWGWHCNNLVIQYNESHHNKTGTTKDGGGFDIDGGSTNCIMQYNYSHDNDGAGYLIAQYNYAPAMKGIIVRYNISENDGRKNGYGAIHLWSSGSNGGIQDAHIYNNTVYLTPSSSGTPKAVWVQQGGTTVATFRNNIFQVSGGVQLVLAQTVANLRFEGNNYWADGNALNINWAGTPYTSLDAWRTGKGQEKLNGVPVGYSLNPQLRDPGKGITVGDPTKLYLLEAYHLKETSPLIGKGLDLATTFGTKTGQRDFYGNSLSQRKDLCIGAHQVTSYSKACLEGGLLPLQFGAATGGTYSGTGVSNGNWFNPAAAGEGNHAFTYSYTDANKQPQVAHHTIAVVNANTTQWTGSGGTSNWFDSRNWSTCVPTSTIDATIPAPQEAIPVMPSITEGQQATARNLDATGTLALDAGGSLEIYGSLSGEQLQTDQSSTLIFNSTSEQNTLAGSFGKLVLETAGTIELTATTTIASELDLGQSQLYLGDHDLILTEEASIKNASPANYLVTEGQGRVTHKTVGQGRVVTFPVGTSTSYAPVILKNSGTTDDFSVSVVDGYLANGTTGPLVTDGVVNKTWHIDEKTAGGSDVKITLQWNEKEEVSKFNRSGAYITHYENSKWHNLLGSMGTVSAVQSTGNYAISTEGATSFSPFSVSSSQVAPLPVTLIRFKATVQDDQVLLRWETASERNSQGFEVEVSTDGKSFGHLGFVGSKTPDSNLKQKYTFRDPVHGKSGNWYYRLRQVDLDGTASYSPVEVITLQEKPQVMLAAYPNPFTNVVTLEIQTLQEGHVQVKLSDSYGKVVWVQRTIVQSGRNILWLELPPQYPAGLYLLTAQQGEKTYQLKLVRK